jgi:hypothetical protein
MDASFKNAGAVPGGIGRRETIASDRTTAR